MEEESHLANGSIEWNNSNNNEIITRPEKGNIDSRPVSMEYNDNEFDVNRMHQGRCGCGSCRPSFMQCFATIRKFVLFLAILSVFQGTLAVGYIGSVVTTIQKRYDLPTYLIGFIISVYDIGCLSAVIFTSYIGGRPTANKPKWITFSSYIMALGAAVYTIPHFLGPIYVPPYIIDKEMQNVDICISSDNNITCEDKEIQHQGTVAVFILAEFLIGVGSTSVLTLGTIYIDDFARRSEGSIFISVLYCMGAAGPALGYVFGSLFLKIYVDVGRVDMDDVQVSPDDERWVGAWWLGFLVCSICVFSSASPIIMYPQSMNKPEEEFDDESRLKQDAEGRVQMSFNSSSFKASLIPAAAIGTVFGAYMIRRFKLGLRGMSKFCFVIIVIGFTILAGTFLLGGCDSVELAGITYPYHYSGESLESNEEVDDFDLLDSCNSACDCSSSHFQPVCASSIGITYFSPCHAGCHGISFGSGENEDNFASNFTMCNCVTKYLQESGESGDGHTYPGKCSNECHLLIPFMFLLISLVIVITMGQIPLVMMTLRSVNDSDRPFALGVQFLLVRLLAYIPSPTYFGAVIDTACILWEDNCGEKGACIEYDNHKFFLVYLGLCASLKIVSIVLVFIVWRLVCRQEANVPYTQGLASHNEDEVIYEFKTGDSKL
ncbi:solute carrier organic anion transporter family member 5A1-like [Anneissia japonica]|uniref:solute carrier organic anion transporter family member 5A1-like n=1 Tax=Anneissia japonica TaxID=1529436 RepID=UPI0014257F55|nr:solute carrier organic anion transporter family member 5A1-like [Anneissia japonica]